MDGQPSHVRATAWILILLVVWAGGARLCAHDGGSASHPGAAAFDNGILGDHAGLIADHTFSARPFTVPQPGRPAGVTPVLALAAAVLPMRLGSSRDAVRPAPLRGWAVPRLVGVVELRI